MKKYLSGFIGAGVDAGGFVAGSVTMGKIAESGAVPGGDGVAAAALVALSIAMGGKGGKYGRRVLRGAGVAGGVRLLRLGLEKLDRSNVLGQYEGQTVLPLLSSFDYVGGRR